MNQIIWIVGLIVIVLFVLGYFGLRWTAPTQLPAA